MSVLDWYVDRMEPIKYENVSDHVLNEVQALVQRRGKTITASTVNDAKLFMLPADTPLYNGALITRLKDNKRYLVIARQYSPDMVHIQGRRVNGVITVSAVKDKYENHKKVGVEVTEVATGVPVYWRDVSAYMLQHDAGLLPSCRRKILIRKDVPIEMYQRVTFTSTDSVYGETTDVRDVYTVEDIDGAQYEGLFSIQLGDDTRK